MTNRTAFLFFFAAALAASAPAARGDLVVTLTETGGGVLGTAVGSVDLTGLNVADGSTRPRSLFPRLGQFVFGPAALTTTDQHDQYFVPPSAGRSGPDSFGGDTFTAATSGTGDFVGFFPNFGNFNVLVPEGYASGGAIAGTATFAGEDFASLDVTPGTYVWEFGANTITLTAGAPAPVPEPSAAALMALACGAWGARRRRARRRDGRV